MVAAAFANSTIAQVDDNFVRLKAIPDDVEKRVKYNNELVTLCGLTLREFSEALRKGGEQTSENKSRKDACSRSRSRDRPGSASGSAGPR